MATPIGHSVAGYGFFLLTDKGSERPRVLLLFLSFFFALLPDLDFLPGLFVGKPALYHHGLSHSVGAAVLAGLLGASLVTTLRREGRSFVGVFLLLFGAYCSHLLLDIVGPDGRPPYGIPLLWPLSQEYFISPVPLLLSVHHAPTTDTSTVEWLTNIFSWHNLLAIGIEIVVVSPFLLLSNMIRSRRSSINAESSTPGNDSSET